MNRPKRENIMLAYPADDGRVSRLGETFYCQPKFRGQRCRVEWFHGEPVLLSSYGNEFRFFDHIKRDLIKSKHRVPFDGELYRHHPAWGQDKINSVCGRELAPHPEENMIQFHIFDVQTPGLDLQMWQRISFLEKEVNETDNIKVAQTLLTNKEQWKMHLVDWVDQGYEGIILRAVHAPYVIKRSVSLLKYKPSEIDEYVIDELLEAIDKHGEPKDILGAFLVHGDDGTVFKVGAGKLKHERRQEIWDKGNFHYKGKILIVKHEPVKTERGVPICAVAVEVKGE